jgi:hypothetical protein
LSSELRALLAVVASSVVVAQRQKTVAAVDGVFKEKKRKHHIKSEAKTNPMSVHGSECVREASSQVEQLCDCAGAVGGKKSPKEHTK